MAILLLVGLMLVAVGLVGVGDRLRLPSAARPILVPDGGRQPLRRGTARG